MSEEIEIDIDDIMLESLKQIAEARLAQFVDKTSMEVFTDQEITSLDDLTYLCGKAFVNSMFIAALEATISETSEE